METYWKVRDVAAALQISEQTVYRYVANWEIPFHKIKGIKPFFVPPRSAMRKQAFARLSLRRPINRSVRFKPSEIERWIESKFAGLFADANSLGVSTSRNSTIKTRGEI